MLAIIQRRQISQITEESKSLIACFDRCRNVWAQHFVHSMMLHVKDRLRCAIPTFPRQMLSDGRGKKLFSTFTPLEALPLGVNTLDGLYATFMQRLLCLDETLRSIL